MFKFMLIPILAIALSAGSYYVESNPTNVFSTEGREIFSRLSTTDLNPSDNEVRTRGFPLAWIDEFGSFDGATEKFSSVTDSFSPSSFTQNTGIWLVVVAVLYFLYEKIRNLVGNIALLGIGAVLAASYFGLITFV